MYLTKYSTDYGISFDKGKKVFSLKLYAPDVSQIKLNINDENFISLVKQGDDFLLTTDKLKFNDKYSFIIDGLFEIPDPFSNFQDKENNLKSVLVKHDEVNWDDKNFRPALWKDAVIYQLHVGCFTKGGTFNDATAKLDYIKHLGINFIQLMPISKFFGKFNWGYDSALHFAVDEKYATPNEFKNFINESHKKGIGVLLDVVYSHFAIEGNYLHILAGSKIYDKSIKTPWGDSINYKNEFVKSYIFQNLIFWLENYHIDGFRFDASHVIDSELMYEIKDFIKSNYPDIYLILENEDNQGHYLKNNFDAQWNDDFHHVVKAGIFKDKYKYLSDYSKLSLSKMITRCISQGYFYQGEYSNYKKNHKGEDSSNLELTKFINFIQNHDQIGNMIDAKRLNAKISKSDFKACALLYLLLPQIPMIFMGEEINSQSPFYYFCDISEELNEIIDKARKDEFKLFGSIKNYVPTYLESTFLDSKICWDKMDYDILDFYKETLKLRKIFVNDIYNQDTVVKYEILDDEVFKVYFNELIILISNFSQRPVSVKYDNIIASSRPIKDLKIDEVPPMTTLWCSYEQN